jgi:hypothetical protein
VLSGKGAQLSNQVHGIAVTEIDRPTGKPTMNKLALAVAIALSGAAICFAFLRRFLVDQDLVGSVFELGVPLALSGLFLGAIATVHQSLKSKRIRPSFTALPGELVSFEQYTIPWYVMIVYGVLMVYPG